MGGGLQETGPEHPGSPTLSLQAHGLQQLSVISPQEASSPFPSNQVLGSSLGFESQLAGGGERWRAGGGEGEAGTLGGREVPVKFHHSGASKKVSPSKSG